MGSVFEHRAIGYPPLPCRASPPQGGRSARRLRSPTSRVALAKANSLIEGQEGYRASISPLEGEMSGRTEGGIRSARARASLPTSPLRQGYRIWIAAAVAGSLFSPAGRSAEPMRGDEGAARHSFCASRPPHPALRATFSPLGRRGTPLRAPLKIHMQLPSPLRGEVAAKRRAGVIRATSSAAPIDGNVADITLPRSCAPTLPLKGRVRPGDVLEPLSPLVGEMSGRTEWGNARTAAHNGGLHG
jgi:hypothetical protein